MLFELGDVEARYSRLMYKLIQVLIRLFIIEGQTNLQDVYIKLTAIFMEALGSVFLDQFYEEAIFSDPIFDDGDRKSWPPCFAEYVKERKTSGKVLQTATFKKDNPGLDRLPADMQPLYLWGKSIKAVADTAKTTINNRLNRTHFSICVEFLCLLCS